MVVAENIVENKQAGMLAVDICRIEIQDCLDFIVTAFQDDKDFINKYHFQDETMDDLIENNFSNIKKLAETKEVKCYALFLEQIPIGFTVISEKLLYSFGINIHCRQADVVLIWFTWIKKIFENNFVVALYRENTRAINFFLRIGLEEFSDDGKVIYLLYNNKNLKLCPEQAVEATH